MKRTKEQRRWIKKVSAYARKDPMGNWRCWNCKTLMFSWANNCIACGCSVHEMYGYDEGYEPCDGLMIPLDRARFYPIGYSNHYCLGCDWRVEIPEDS